MDREKVLKFLDGLTRLSQETGIYVDCGLGQLPQITDEPDGGELYCYPCDELMWSRKRGYLSAPSVRRVEDSSG